MIYNCNIYIINKESGDEYTIWKKELGRRIIDKSFKKNDYSRLNGNLNLKINY